MVGPIPANFSFTAWGVKYEYRDLDSAFVSDNITLNAVYELSRWTLDGGVIDTYTDSNTRERRPYECDGLIASANRQLLQSDAMWARHSHRWFSHMHYFVQHAGCTELHKNYFKPISVLAVGYWRFLPGLSSGNKCRRCWRTTILWRRGLPTFSELMKIDFTTAQILMLLTALA